MLQPERQQSVLELLKGMGDSSTNPASRYGKFCDLIWSQLNYQHVSNKSLSRRKWTDTAAKALAEDPRLFASGGTSNDFHVIYARLASNQLLLGQERPVVSRLLQEDHLYTLFVFSNSAQDRWHFLNVKYDEKSDKRRLFRRITVGPEERLRTASERLAMLDLEYIHPDLFGLSPLAIQQHHDDAFDVEAVTKQFFKIFAELYHKVADDIAQVRGLEKEAGKLAQLLLNRMLFLYFIQKKGWLNGEPDYLYTRFQECWRKDPNGHSYYSTILYPLFLCLSNADAEDTVSAVPFLNGGLFEESVRQSQAERLEQARLKIRNTTFKAIFSDLLERFNFTVTEDTPLDVEVAIDPEMLGKIFESLILQLEKDPDKDLRKLTGSYYTPRPVVHFMCQEGLQEYLVTRLAGDDMVKADEIREKVGTLLVLPPADQLDEEQVKILRTLFTATEARTLRQAILDCRICDPAVGSGAFPVGMLHEMVAAIARLDLCFHGPDVLKRRNYDYDLKKQIIESCLYGVDIQEQAVRLCELRLWLSLVVDYQIDPNKPFAKAIREVLSLPNLSYHIVRGDSLLERLFGHVVQLDQMTKDAKTQRLIESIQADKMSYFREGNTAEKRRLELKILAKQADLAERLVEAKGQSLVQHNLSLFEESAKDKKLREIREAQQKQLDDLKKKIYSVKTELERLSREKRLITHHDLDALRRKYFHTGSHPTFMWRVDFAEVFREKGGFDICIANPPYLGESGHKEIFREICKSEFGQQFHEGKMDIFYFFLELSTVHLTHEHGQIVFITTNYWPTATGAKKLRSLLRDSTSVHRLINFGELRIFESAQGQHNLISVIQKPRVEDTPCTIMEIVAQGYRPNVVDRVLRSGSSGNDVRVMQLSSQKQLYDASGCLSLSTKQESRDLCISWRKMAAFRLASICNINQRVVSGCDSVSTRNVEKLWDKSRVELGDGIFVLDSDNPRDRQILDRLNTHERHDLLKPFFQNSDIVPFLCSKKPTKHLLYLHRGIVSG